MITVEWTDEGGQLQRRELPTGDGLGRLRKHLKRQGITPTVTHSAGSTYRGIRAIRGTHQPDPRVWASFRRNQ